MVFFFVGISSGGSGVAEAGGSPKSQVQLGSDAMVVQMSFCVEFRVDGNATADDFLCRISTGRIWEMRKGLFNESAHRGPGL